MWKLLSLTYTVALYPIHFSPPKLRIETGRYERPFVPRDERLCAVCHVLEDEDRVIFKHAVSNDTRIKFNRLLSINNTVKKVLNPKYEFIKETANLLYEIDKIKEKTECGELPFGGGGGYEK